MAEMIRVPEMSEEQRRVLRLLSPEEKLKILVEAATGRRERLSERPPQISFNGTLYTIYELDRLDLAVQAMTEGRPVVVHRSCILCASNMYDTPVLRNQWSDACSACEQALNRMAQEQEKGEEA